jgi:hypothetical protein
MQLSVEMGVEDAMNQMLAPMEGEAETFCELWSEGRKDIEKGTKGTVDDVVRAISIAKEGFNGYPRKILVVQMAETRASLLLVSPQGTHPLEGQVRQQRMLRHLGIEMWINLQKIGWQRCSPPN